MITRRAILFSALGMTALTLSGAPARADERVIRKDLNLSYVIPDGYHNPPPSRRDAELSIDLEGPDSLARDIGNNTVLHILSGIFCFVDEIPKGVGSLQGMDEQDVRDFVKFIPGSLRFEDRANIRIAGREAVAIFCAGRLDDSIREDVGLRLILMADNGKLYLFGFACTNAEFPVKVKPFEQFMKSLRFLSDPPPRNVAPPKKPAGNKPTKKKG